MKTTLMFVGAVLIYAAMSTLLYFLEKPVGTIDLLRDIAYLIPPALVVLAALLAVRTYGWPHPMALAAISIGGGILYWFAGDFIYTVLFNLGFDPFPSVADVLYLSGYPLLLAGFLFAARSERAERTRRSGLLFYSIVLVVAVVVFYLGVVRAFDPELSLLANAFGMAYGVGDLILIIPLLKTIEFAWAHRGGLIAGPWVLMLIALGTILASDIAFAQFGPEYDTAALPFRLIDLGWVYGYLLLATGLVFLSTNLRRLQRRLLK